MLLSMPAGCGSHDDKGPQTIHESLAQLQEQAKQLEQSSSASQAVTASSSEENENHPSAGTYKVKFETTAGDFVIEVHRDWSPIGAERFHRLVNSGFYNECRFFRVVPDFMVQFGINGDPAIQQQWDRNLLDDPKAVSNKKGYVSFATGGPNTRTTQVFINYKDNGDHLDIQGFTPFGEVIDGMNHVEAIFSTYGESPVQQQIKERGNEYLNENFPKLDYIKTASIIEDDAKDRPEPVIPPAP